jgi:hypothetical protein
MRSLAAWVRPLGAVWLSGEQMLGWPTRSDDSDDQDIAEWMARRNADVANLNDPEAESAGRDAWNAGTRDGTNVAAQTPLDLRSLGAVQLACGPSPAAGGVWQQVRAGARGAEDAVFLGHANEVGSALGSIPALVSGDPVGARYEALLRQGRDQDRFDEIHYPIARNIGEVVGTVGALAATDGLAAAAIPKFGAAAFSAARAMPAMTRTERASIALGGAGLGVLGQGYSDILSDHRSPWTDYVSSALGGAGATSTAARMGPMLGGASGAMIRSFSEGALNDRLPDLTDTSHDMVGAGYLGAFGKVVGEQESNRLHSWDKGDLGEAMSDLKSYAQGNPTIARQVPKRVSNGGRTVVDSINRGPQPYVESKFGPTANLSPSQRAWQADNPGQVRNDFWMPHHVGQITGSVLSSLGVPMIDGWDQHNRQP